MSYCLVVLVLGKETTLSPVTWKHCLTNHTDIHPSQPKEKKKDVRTSKGEVERWLSDWYVVEDLSSVPNTYQATHDSSFRGSNFSYGKHTHVHKLTLRHTYTHNFFFPPE